MNNDRLSNRKRRLKQIQRRRQIRRIMAAGSLFLMIIVAFQVVRAVGKSRIAQITLQADNPFDETLYDITTYIESFPVQSMEYKILSLFFYQYKTDSEIASILHVSRQYINRQKKKLLKTYFFRHPD